MDLTLKYGTISHQVLQNLEGYFSLRGLETKRSFVLSNVLTFDIVGRNTAMGTLINFRNIVSNIKSEKTLDKYMLAVLKGGQKYDPCKPKKKIDYYQKWCN